MSRGGPEIKAIFTGTIDRPPGPEREAYLAAACGGDAGLRRRIEDLLAALDRASDILGPSGPPADPTTADVPTEADAAATSAFEPARRPDPEVSDGRSHAADTERITAPPADLLGDGLPRIPG